MRSLFRPTVIALASILSACAAQQAQRPSQAALAQCSSLSRDAAVSALYTPGNVTRVEPAMRREFLARAIQPVYVSGANLYVPAEPGVTRAYLQRALTCHANSTQTLHPSDPLRVEGITSVSVHEAGPAMRIAVVGKDRKSGRAIWERAQALHQQAADVTVEQLSATPAAKQGL